MPAAARGHPRGSRTWHPWPTPSAPTVIRSGGIGGFSVTDADAVRARGFAIADATSRRTMPPLPVDTSGNCQSFLGVRALSPDEISLFQRWYAGGMPMGEPGHAPSTPAPPAALVPDTTIDIGVDFLPKRSADGRLDEVRCFLTPSPTPDTRFVTAYHVIPGDARVVHHLVVHTAPSAEAEAEAEAADARDARPGFDCLAPDHPQVQSWPTVVTWAPSLRPARFPPGLGFRIEGGRRIGWEIHDSVRAGEFPDRTRIDLETTDRVDHPVDHMAVWSGMSELHLAPHEAAATAEGTAPLGIDAPVKLWLVAPHMHALGRKLRVDLVRNGVSTCLVDTPRFAFAENALWFYAQPITVLPTDLFHIRCEFDTTSRDTVTLWDDTTDGEMCIGNFYGSP